MIKIQPYYAHPAHKKIFDRYLYLVSMALPFPPQMVIGDDMLDVDGRQLRADTFLDQTGKRPLKRSKAYVEALSAYGIKYAPRDEAGQFEQDQLLAARIIQESSPELYAYLFKADNKYAWPLDVPPMKRENVRRLLTVPMNCLDNELKGIGKIRGKTVKTAGIRDKSEDLLNFVFRYDSFSRRNQTFHLLKDMDVNVCPYCNRIYTVTVTKKGHKSRPQFDHYKNKSNYPYFALSILNLVPSCSLCNQAKSSKEEEVMYPYFDEMGTNVMFRTKAEAGLTYLTGCQSAEDEFRIELEVLEGISEELRRKVECSDKVFHLTQLYNRHKDYVLYLYRKRYIFTEDYLQTICKNFPDMAGSYKELKGLLYLMDLDKGQWGRRSLAKLTHDIDQQITEGEGN